MSKKIKIESSKKREKLNLFGGEKVFDMSVLKGAHTEIFGNNRIVVEGCLGLYEYNDCYLKLKLVKGALIVSGSSFDISAIVFLALSHFIAFCIDIAINKSSVSTPTAPRRIASEI